MLKRNVDPGQTVASSLQAPVLFTIAEDLTQMEVQVDVDEADVGKVKEGQKATFTVDAYPDRKFPAAIRDLRFGSEIVQGVVTYKAVLSIDNSESAAAARHDGDGRDRRAARVQGAARAQCRRCASRRRPSGRGQTAASCAGSCRAGRPFRPPARGTRAVPIAPSGRRAEWRAVPVSVLVGATDGQRTEIVKGEIADGQGVIVDARPPSSEEARRAKADRSCPSR